MSVDFRKAYDGIRRNLPLQHNEGLWIFKVQGERERYRDHDRSIELINLTEL